MKLLKPTKHASVLIPYKSFFIQLHHQQDQLISEQNPGELNPLFQLGIETTQTHVTTWAITLGTIPMPFPTQTAPRAVSTSGTYVYVHSILKNFIETHCISYIDD
jgi:hypothetical protein